MTLPRHAQAAAVVRAQVSDGTLRPGEPAPSGAELARLTGFSPLTCRHALRSLITAGTLVPGPSRNARPRVAAPAGQHAAGEAGRVLSRALAALRRASGMTQPALARVTGYSVTTVGHAETGRLWQSRGFWEKADLALAASGELTRRYDVYRAAAGTPGPGTAPPAPPAYLPAPVSVVITWADGTDTTVYPPGFAAP